MDLGGSWHAIPAAEGLRRTFAEPDLDDSGWPILPVPGHWQAASPFGDGPVLYRHRFTTEAPAHGRRAWLILDGIFYQSDIWLDGSYLGDTEGYFFPHAFEVTAALRDRSDHLLAIEVACTPSTDPEAKRNLTGAFDPGTGIGRGANPGGIWRPVQIVETGPVRISRCRVLCTEARAERAVLEVHAVLDAGAPADATLTAVVTDQGGGEVARVHADHVLAAGENRMMLTLRVAQPQLWWPWALGDQARHDVELSVTDGDGCSDHVTRRTGIREIRMRQWIFTVNGERLFLKGAGLAPEATVASARPDGAPSTAQAARAAGLDLLRVRGHIGRPELYDDADSAGLLLWQDMPLQGGYVRGVRKQAVRQAREAVDFLGHHPSIALWCAHDEPPAWNAVTLDGSVKRALERADRTRPAISHAAESSEGDYAARYAAVPRLARFVTSADRRPDGAREQIEAVRRIKYRPAGGFCQLWLADDPRDVVAACAPVIVVADPPRPAYGPGEPVTLDVHVVSDLRTTLHDATVTATVAMASGARHWSWGGDVASDTCVRIGSVDFVTPDEPGSVRLSLQLRAGDAVIRNEYVTSVQVGLRAGRGPIVSRRRRHDP